MTWVVTTLVAIVLWTGFGFWLGVHYERQRRSLPFRWACKDHGITFSSSDADLVARLGRQHMSDEHA